MIDLKRTLELLTEICVPPVLLEHTISYNEQTNTVFVNAWLNGKNESFDFTLKDSDTPEKIVSDIQKTESVIKALSGDRESQLEKLKALQTEAPNISDSPFKIIGNEILHRT